MSYHVTEMLSNAEASDYQQSVVDFFATGNPYYGELARDYERTARKRYGGGIPADDAVF